MPKIINLPHLSWFVNLLSNNVTILNLMGNSLGFSVCSFATSMILYFLDLEIYI